MTKLRSGIVHKFQCSGCNVPYYEKKNKNRFKVSIICEHLRISTFRKKVKDNNDSTIKEHLLF